MKPKISVVINTFNEERNLENALRSVCKWADEIVVVDMHSADKTVEIAQRYGAQVYMFARMNFSEPAREFAIVKATSDWVLIVDADEIIPARLSRKLLQLAQDDIGDVYVVPRLTYVLGAPMFYTACGPDQDAVLRFFKKNMVVLSPRIHQFISPVPAARVRTLTYEHDLAIMHFTNSETTQVIERLNRYTSIEAQQAFERGEHGSWLKAILHACYEFVNRYVRKQGFRDGWRGFYFSGYMAAYRWVTYGKLQALRSTGGREEVEHIYRKVAEEILAGYDSHGVS